MLARIAQCCNCLEELNVSGSIGVSDEGILLLSGAPLNTPLTNSKNKNKRWDYDTFIYVLKEFAPINV